MKITEKQLRMLSDYYNTSDPFLNRKEVMVHLGIKVLAIYHPDKNQHMPKEVWQPLELWHERHENSNS
jgi:hypothetical protein